MSSTKRDHYADQKIDVDEVIKSNTNLVKKLLGTSMAELVTP